MRDEESLRKEMEGSDYHLCSMDLLRGELPQKILHYIMYQYHLFLILKRKKKYIYIYIYIYIYHLSLK